MLNASLVRPDTVLNVIKSVQALSFVDSCTLITALPDAIDSTEITPIAPLLDDAALSTDALLAADESVCSGPSVRITPQLSPLPSARSYDTVVAMALAGALSAF